MKDGSGNVIAKRTGIAVVTVKNGDKSVKISSDLIHIPDKRDPVIGLCSFNDFGYKMEGVPTKPPASDSQCIPELTNSVEDMLAVNGLPARDLSDEVVLYSTIDIRDSYFRLRLHEKDLNWIAFEWRGVHCRFPCAPFGIKTMPPISKW